MGCDAEQPLNFNEDIAPIIYENCQNCHHEKGIAPFSLTSYREVAENARLIKKVTASRYMPPWNADPTYQSYLYEGTLSEEEIDKIGSWVDQGFPEGDSSLVKNPLDFISEDTLIQKPDLTICMEEAWKITGNNEDHYQTFVIPVKMEKDCYVQALEFKPGNVKAVHHAQVLVDSTGMAYAYDQQSPEYGFGTFTQMKFKVNGILTGYLPGGNGPVKYPDGTGKKLAKQSYVIFNVHYAPTPIDEWDQSCLDIYFSEESKPQEIHGQTVRSTHLTNGPFELKANTTRYFHAVREVHGDMALIAVWPHMHFRGKSFEAYVKTSWFNRIPLVRIDSWDFNWQNAYFFESMIDIPAGAEIHVKAVFDNTASNPFNPVIPPVDVKWGSSSYDEMLILGMEFLDVSSDNEK